MKKHKPKPKKDFEELRGTLKALYELEGEVDLLQSVGLYIVTGRMIEFGDKRYSSLHQILSKKLIAKKTKVASLMSDFNDRFLIEKYGMDPALEKRSIKSYKIDEQIQKSASS